MGGQHGREFAAAPLGRDRTVLEGGLVNEAIEVHCECTGHLGRSTGARTVDKALRALVSQAMDPLTQGGIRQVQRVGDGLEALPCDDLAHGLGAPEDTGLLGPLQEGISGGEGILRKVQFEGPHDGGLQNKLLQKYKHPTSPHVVPLL